MAELGREEHSADAPAINALVVTYNNADHILGCLRSVLEQLPPDGSMVTVVDNASTDGTADLVAAKGAGIDLVRSTENLGFARACNMAAARRSARYVLLVNPDATLQPGCVDALLDLARRHPAAGFYGGRALSPDGSLDPSSCFGQVTLWSLFCFATGLSAARPSSPLFNAEGMGDWARDDERDVDVISGFLLLIDGRVWRELAGFDERFVMYGEDFDLSMRAQRVGCSPRLTPDAGIVHVGGASSTAVNKQILLFRGKVTLVRKIWPGRRGALAERLLATGVGLRALLAGGRVSSLVGVGRSDQTTTPGTWQQLWHRRAEWRDGWPDAGSARTSASVSSNEGRATGRDSLTEGVLTDMTVDDPVGGSLEVELTPRGVRGRARLAGRVVKFGLRSARSGDREFAVNSVRSFGDLVALSAADVVSNGKVTCNMCGWSGRSFYPNTGPGYDERNSLCPGCLSSDRYRTLYETLRLRTGSFASGSRTIEVAPLPSLQSIFLRHRDVRYTSFDLERFAMEQGDITAMRFEDDSVDWFICFHVLEHVPDESKALGEIHRVLRPDGSAVLQVPVDWEVAETREYGAPDPRDVGHVRRHGADFVDRIAAHGFVVRKVDPVVEFGFERVRAAGLSPEPIFIAQADKGSTEEL